MAAGHSMQVTETALQPVPLRCWSVVTPWKAKLSSSGEVCPGPCWARTFPCRRTAWCCRQNERWSKD